MEIRIWISGIVIVIGLVMCDPRIKLKKISTGIFHTDLLITISKSLAIQHVNTAKCRVSISAMYESVTYL